MLGCVIDSPFLERVISLPEKLIQPTQMRVVKQIIPLRINRVFVSKHDSVLKRDLLAETGDGVLVGTSSFILPSLSKRYCGEMLCCLCRARREDRVQRCLQDQTASQISKYPYQFPREVPQLCHRFFFLELWRQVR